jgi:hypothetical protein
MNAFFREFLQPVADIILAESEQDGDLASCWVGVHSTEHAYVTSKRRTLILRVDKVGWFEKRSIEYLNDSVCLDRKECSVLSRLVGVMVSCLLLVTLDLGSVLTPKESGSVLYLSHSTLKDLDTEVGAELLSAGAGRVGQVLCVDTETVCGIANSIALLSEKSEAVVEITCSTSTYKVADVHSLRDPVGGDSSKSSRKTVNVVSGVSAVSVGVASQASAVLGVTDKEDTLNGIE